MSDPQAFPYPIPEIGSEPYWQACNERRLVMQRCTECRQFRWHPAPLCTHCSSDAFNGERLSGLGKITTWTEVTHPVHPAAVGKVPYIVVEVELAEQPGLRMLSNLVSASAAEIDFDAPVKVDFSEHPGGQQLPVFRLLDR